MKHRYGIASLIVLNLTLLVLFQNCGLGSNEQSTDTSYINDTLNDPEVYITTGAPANDRCNQQFISQNSFSYGAPFTICIRNAGSNPNYCITNTQSGGNQCFLLPTESTWYYSGSADLWQKTYPTFPQTSYYPVGSYNIRVIDTVDSTSNGQVNFTVQ